MKSPDRLRSMKATTLILMCAFAMLGSDAIAQKTTVQQPNGAQVDNAAKLRQLDAQILATRQQMVQTLRQAANTRGSYEALPEMQAAMEAAKQQVAVLQNDLNNLLAMRDELKGRPNGARQAPVAGQGSGYLSKIEKKDEGVLILGNQAAVEISDSFLGHIGRNVKCLLFKDGTGWKIWIEGKKTYSCELLRAPENARTVDLSSVTINEALSDGKFLRLNDGRILKVDEFDQIHTHLLLPPEDALLMDSRELVMLDDGKVIRVEEVAE